MVLLPHAWSQDTQSVDLSGLLQSSPRDWEPFHDAAFQPGERSGSSISVQSRPERGSGDRGAFLKGIEFTDGTIEVDLKGSTQPASSFLGVVFNAEGGETYEAVYFRPFNFGQADPARRSHAVQYMSPPEWPWRRLRGQYPGKYENAVDPEPRGNEWFHARIVVDRKTVSVFVNGDSKPCLEVDRLADDRSGKVGLWFNGIAEFANLKIQPAS